MNLSHIPLLSIMIWLPILGAVPVALCGEKRANQAYVLALIIAIITFALCAPLYYYFDTSTAAMQFTENFSWVAALKINYSLGIDGISLPLIVLGAFTTLLIVLAAKTMVHTKMSQYFATF